MNKLMINGLYFNNDVLDLNLIPGGWTIYSYLDIKEDELLYILFEDPILNFYDIDIKYTGINLTKYDQEIYNIILDQLYLIDPHYNITNYNYTYDKILILEYLESYNYKEHNYDLIEAIDEYYITNIEPNILQEISNILSINLYHPTYNTDYNNIDNMTYNYPLILTEGGY